MSQSAVKSQKKVLRNLYSSNEKIFIAKAIGNILHFTLLERLSIAWIIIRGRK